jgi:metal-responsive CopG/Arc/MetJ family transcriptional regulator
MRTVQVQLDDALVTSIDRMVKRLGTTRSAFTRQALRAALKENRVKELARKQREGYARKPVRPGEFDVWEGEQAWGK